MHATSRTCAYALLEEGVEVRLKYKQRVSICYRENVLNPIEALEILSNYCNNVNLLKSKSLIDGLLQQYRNNNQILKTEVEKIEPYIINELKDPCLIYAWLRIHEVIQDFFNKCNCDNKTFSAKVLNEKSLSLLKILVNDVQSTILDKNSKNHITIVVICYCFTLLSEYENKDNLLKLSKILGIDNALKIKYSIIELIRHATAHSNIEFISNDIVKFTNDKDILQINQDDFINRSIKLLNYYLKSNTTNNCHHIRIIQNIMIDLRMVINNKRVTTYTILLSTMMMSIIIVSETQEKTFQKMEKIPNNIINNQDDWNDIINKLNNDINDMCGFDCKKLRNAFAHGDYEIRGNEVLPRYDKNYYGVYNVKELVDVCNKSQIIYRMPIMAECIALLLVYSK